MQTLFVNGADYTVLRSAVSMLPDLSKIRELVGEPIFDSMVWQALCGGTTTVLVDEQCNKPKLLNDDDSSGSAKLEER